MQIQTLAKSHGYLETAVILEILVKEKIPSLSKIQFIFKIK